jgi:UDP-2-acetamido-3-amino-2,3-dideoxy-glucuronate N-acetyltransferase
MTAVDFFVHPTADVSPEARIGAGTRIWALAQVREGAIVGEDCILGRGVYIDARVHVGARVKIQNYVSIFEGVTIEDGVFIGPHVCFTNDRLPRAITPDGRLKGPQDWEITPTLVKYGASIGARALVVCGVTIGEFALVGAGAVVTRDVPPHALVYGNPARLQGYVCRCARRLQELHRAGGLFIGRCPVCAQEYHLPLGGGLEGTGASPDGAGGEPDRAMG